MTNTSTDEPLVIRFRLERDEFLQLMRGLFVHKTRQFRGFSLVVVVAVVLLLLMYGRDSGPELYINLATALIFPTAMLVVFPILATRDAGRKWEQFPSPRGIQTLEFSEVGIQQSGEGETVDYSWSSAIAARQIHVLAVIEFEGSLHLAIPLRAFDSISDWTKFISILNRKIGSKRVSLGPFNR